MDTSEQRDNGKHSPPGSQAPQGRNSLPEPLPGDPGFDRHTPLTPPADSAGVDTFSARFNLLWGSQWVSQLGDFIAYVTLPLFALAVTSTSFELSLVYVAETIPTLFFGFIGAGMLDRLHLRPVMAVSDLIRAALFAVLALMAASGATMLALLYLIAFTLGTATAVFNSGLFAAVPSLSVVSPAPASWLERANARFALTQQVTFLIGPALGGFIAGSWGLVAGFVINAASFAISAIMVYVALPSIPPAAQGALRERLLVGMVFIWKDRILASMQALTMSVNLATGFIEGLFVLLASQRFDANDSEIGIMFAAAAFGGVVGALLATRVLTAVGPGRSMTLAIALSVIAVTALATAPSFVVVLPFIAAGFMGLPLLNVVIATMRQVASPPAILGRVTAASRALAWGALPVGALAGGALADYTSLTLVTFIAAGLLLAAAAVSPFTPIGKVRSLETAYPSQA